MPAASGALVLIKIGNGEDPEVFTTIGGMRTSELSIDNQLLDASHIEGGNWRILQNESGIQSVSISGSGIFVDSTEEENVRISAFANTIKNYRFIFANADSIQGPFRILSYQRKGDHNNPEAYNLTLESAGPITFTAG